MNMKHAQTKSIVVDGFYMDLASRLLLGDSSLSAAPTPSRKLPQNKTICTLHRIEIECVHRVIAVCVCGSDCPVTLLFAGPSLWLCFTNHQNVKIFIMTYNLCITNTEPKKKKKTAAEAKRKMY